MRPRDKVYALIVKLREFLKLRPEDAIFLFANSVTLTPNSSFGEIYTKYRDEDGFLYIIIAEFPVYGLN